MNGRSTLSTAVKVGLPSRTAVGRYAKFSIMESGGEGLVPTPGGQRRTGNAAFS